MVSIWLELGQRLDRLALLCLWSWSKTFGSDTMSYSLHETRKISDHSLFRRCIIIATHPGDETREAWKHAMDPIAATSAQPPSVHSRTLYHLYSRPRSLWLAWCLYACLRLLWHSSCSLDRAHPWQSSGSEWTWQVQAWVEPGKKGAGKVYQSQPERLLSGDTIVKHGRARLDFLPPRFHEHVDSPSPQCWLRGRESGKRPRAARVPGRWRMHEQSFALILLLRIGRLALLLLAISNKCARGFEKRDERLAIYLAYPSFPRGMRNNGWIFGHQARRNLSN
jgi:hypothetical protein